MKKIALGLAALCFACVAHTQNDIVNALFAKYSGSQGVTTINVTGDMLKLITQAEQERRDTIFNSTLSEVRILSVEKNCENPVVLDLRNEVYDKLDKSLYKEMVSIKQADEDVVIMLRENKGRIIEVLIIAGGKDNALIQVKGDMLLSELAHMADKYQMKGFEQLKKLEN